MTLDYIKYGTVGLAVLAIIGIFIWFLSENKKLTTETIKLKAEIALLQAHQDTSKARGKDSTIYITKWLKLPPIKVKNRDIDTTIEVPEHTVKVKIDSENVNIEVECKKVEKITERTDTLRIPIPELVEVQIPCEEDPWYNSKEAYLGYGAAAILVVIKTLGQLLNNK